MVKKVFAEEFKALEDYMRQFLPEGSDRDLAILKLKESAIFATKSAATKSAASAPIAE